MALKFAAAIKKARSELGTITGLELESTISAQPDGDGWRVTLEALEKKSIPDSMDILGIFEVNLDADGNISEFNRVRMRKRIDMDENI
ncbi:MAG: gas vesicle protein [Proteobacteria bacterium]|nr:gas vesicle protein [Pseudomonadota bacterium]MBU1585167.1 gas vesicle protein [Pseudomonadota bacterium]MBU2454480.1 gas vesicle protein [Pseudomonadota bacterium]MBU2629057.1 gas vesicle protein [Pseudomonadota bacterium]